jgi:TonB family protein
VAALVAAVHILVICLLIMFGTTRSNPSAVAVPPIVVSLITQTKEPPLARPSRLSRPQLAMIQVALTQPIPEFQVPAPLVPAPSARPIRKIAQGGGPVGLTIIHYVAPVYLSAWARLGMHGRIVMALKVSAQWGVAQVKVLRSTGWRALDRAATGAARQWRFEPVKGVAPGKPIWGVVSILFAPPQQLVHVPMMIMPYAAIAGKLALNTLRTRERRLHVLQTTGSVHHLLQKIIAAYPRALADARSSPDASADSLDRELAGFGPIRSVTFLGFVRHGVAEEGSNSDGTGSQVPLEAPHWEAYDVEQTRGSSVWLVEATPDGRLQRIEVAVR